MPTSDVAHESQQVQVRSPYVDIVEDDQALWLSADLPGVAPGNVAVAIDDGTLTLTGRIDDPNQASAPASEFRRGFTFTDPSRFDSEHVSAVFRHGVLELRIPKAERARRRQIPVSVN